jgi:hypothetical protein
MVLLRQEFLYVLQDRGVLAQEASTEPRQGFLERGNGYCSAHSGEVG